MCFPAIRSMSTARVDAESFVRGGPTLTTLLLVDGFAGGPMMAQPILTADVVAL